MDGGREPRSRPQPRKVPHRVFAPEKASPGLSLVVPAYNEEARLHETLPAMWEFLHSRFKTFELIIVDDGSSDGTARVVEEFATDRPGVVLISYRPNRGKGHAVRMGVLRAQGDLILFSDADLATPLEEFDHLLEPIQSGSSVAIASRGARGAQRVIRQPWYRELAGRCFNLMVQCLAVPGIKDTQCGFKLFPRSVAHDVFARYEEDGFSFDIEVLHIARRLGYPIAEVPVRWMHREGSKVKMSRDVPRMFMALLRIRRRHHHLRKPPRRPHIATPASSQQMAERS
jgi:dolichyl-phosphate beta-glucosyltransferase